jgi:hypothetical protein
MTHKFKAYLTWKNLYGIFLHIIVVILAVDVVILASQIKELKQGPRRSSSDRSLQVGDSLILGGGKQVYGPIISSSTNAGLYFIYTTKCPFCRRSLSAWSMIDSIVSGSHIVVRGVCMDSLQNCLQYSADHRLKFAVFVPDSAERFKKQNHIAGVPCTVLVSDSGRVEKLWLGMVDEEKLSDVKKELATLIGLARRTRHLHEVRAAGS